MENNDDDIRFAHFQEQLEAASYTASGTHHATMHMLEENHDYSRVEKNRSRLELVKGYLLEEWTWLNTLQEKIDNDEEIPAPEHCEHIDPMHPTVWVGLLAKPNSLLCMECALETATKDVQSGQELCDRCHETNASGEFYEFMMPLVNIQLIGSICKSCLDKV